MSDREYLGRSAAGNRVGIYVERKDWEERYFVGRDAELPCAMRRWWTETATAWDLLFFHDLGFPTVSTSTAIASALWRRLGNNYTVGRRNWDLYVEGTKYEISRCRWGCGDLWPRQCPHAETFGIYDVLHKCAVVWPEGMSWTDILKSSHFAITPEVTA